MAGLATEVHRLGVLICLVTAERSEKQEDNAARGKNSENLPVTRTR